MDLGQPLLQREPDARRAPFGLFGDVAPLYLALMVGLPIATLVSLWNLVLVRRFGRALLVLVIGVLGAVGNTIVVGGAASAGIAPGVAFFLGQVGEIGCGALMYRTLRAPVRGHRLLEGQLVSMSLVVFGAFIVQFALPGEVLVPLHHPLLLLVGTP